MDLEGRVGGEYCVELERMLGFIAPHSSLGRWSRVSKFFFSRGGNVDLLRARFYQTSLHPFCSDVCSHFCSLSWPRSPAGSRMHLLGWDSCESWSNQECVQRLGKWQLGR